MQIGESAQKIAPLIRGCSLCDALTLPIQDLTDILDLHSLSIL